VNKHLLDCTDPRVPGAHAVGIEETPGSNTGIVALLVPQSEGGPHRAKSASERINDRYYARQGTQTIMLEHSLLEDRFGRTAPPRFQLIFQLHGSASFAAGLEVRIRNIGRGTAMQPAVLFQDMPPDLEVVTYQARVVSCLVFEPVHPVPTTSSSYLLKPHGSPEILIYPTLEMHAVNLPFSHRRDFASKLWSLRLRGIIYALNAQPRYFDITLETAEGEDPRNARSWIAPPDQ
jgi:hypothetical protein